MQIQDLLNISKKEEEKMINHFKKRTLLHIEYVQFFLTKIIELNDSFIANSVLESEKIHHDECKFKEPEYIPYVLLTWRYLQREKNKNFDYPPNIQNMITQITQHHVTHNKHHPEYWTNQKLDLINPNDRDKPPEKVIDCTDMPLSYIACMVADWLAMSLEKKTNPYEWAKSNIGVRWKFDKEQINFIYKLIDKIWK